MDSEFSITFAQSDKYGGAVLFNSDIITVHPFYGTQWIRHRPDHSHC